MSTRDDDGLSARERAFADRVIGGMAACRAYQEAGYKGNEHTAGRQAYVVLRRERVANYIRTERRALAELCRMEKWELVEFLCKAITTPVGEVTEDSPLAQEVTVDVMARERVRTRVKMIGKLDSAKLLSAMLGWTGAERNVAGGGGRLAELVGLIRRVPGGR